MSKNSWPIKTLGEVAVLNPSEPALSEDAPFVPMDAVTAGIREVQYTQPRGQRSGSRARAGDILFARITPCLQNGKVALVQDEIARCGGSTEFIVVRTGSEVLNGYLYQWITSDHIRDEVTVLMKGATGRQRLNAEDLALTELPVPPLEEQKRIVALLDAVTASVAELIACYENARTHANNLFTSAVRETLASNLDWPVKTLGEVALVNPSEPALSVDAPFVPMDAVTAGIRDVQYTQPRGQRSGARARAGDILFARITPCLQNGKVALVQDEIARCGGSTEFIVVRAGSEVLNGFLYQWITSDHIRAEVTALMKGATGRQRLNAEDLALTELPIPSLEEQRRLVMRLDSMKAKTSEMVAAYDAKLAAAKNLRQSILESAFAGEL
jgi:type I restriction enzyme S subunit